jgi:hypothetical protein
MNKLALRLIVPFFLLPTVGSGQDKSMRDTLGTRLTATSETIVLDWDPKHPWSADIARGANLMAEYDTKTQGVVLQSLAQGKATGGSVTSMRFVLPEALTVSPVGPVCLFVRLSNSKVLPVRKPDQSHSDTSRFRDQSWEVAATSHTGLAEQKRFLSELQAASDNADRQLELKRQSLGKIGWSEGGGCKSIVAPSFASATKPDDVLPLERQPAAARRACVTRALGAQLDMQRAMQRADSDDHKVDILLRYMTMAVMPPDLSDYLLSVLSSSKLDLSNRRRQLVEFQRDWDTYSKNPEDRGHPILGDVRDDISLQAITSEIGQDKEMIPVWIAFLTHKPASSLIGKINPEKVAGFAGGELEAYSRCVVDSQKQLRSKLDQWEINLADAPRLNEMARQELIASCEKDSASLPTLVAAQNAAHDRLSKAQQTQPSRATGTTLSASGKTLNAFACSVQR